MISNIDSDLEFVLDADAKSYSVNVDVTPAECGSEVSTADKAAYLSLIHI